MNNSIALLMFLAAAGGAAADPLTSEADVSTNDKTVVSHPATTSPLGIPHLSPRVEPVLVTSNRPRSLDRALGVLEFQSTSTRTLSTPLELDVVSGPVLVTVRTGNTEELHRNRVRFPFESVQESTVRNSDVLKIRFAKFKLV